MPRVYWDMRAAFQLANIVNPYNAEIIVYKPWRPKGTFQIENPFGLVLLQFFFQCYKGNTYIHAG